MSPNLQDERSEANAPPSFWQRLFSLDPTPPGKKKQELEALAARVQALEQQHQSELAGLRQQLEQQQEEREQQQQSEKEGGREGGREGGKEDGQGLRYSGTWTVELAGANCVHCTPIFNLGGFSFRVVLTEKKKEDNDDMRLIAGTEGGSEQEKGEGGRPVGVYLEYLPSSNAGGGAVVAAVPCVQCRFELLLEDERKGEGKKERGKDEGEDGVYESAPTFLDAAGGALGLDAFTHVWDHCPSCPLPLYIPQQQQHPQQQHQSKLCVGFDVSLRSVHFLGATEQARALREAWARTETAVEEQVRAALMREEEKRAAAEMRMKEEGEWKEVVDSWLFVGGGGGEGGRGESGEEEKVCVERSCDKKNDDDDEKEKEEEEEQNEKEGEKSGEKEEVRAGGRDQNERRRRENTGGREAEEEEEEVGQAEDDGGDNNEEEEYNEEEDDEIDEEEEEEEEIEVKGA